MTDDDYGYWSIYDEQGEALERDFSSEEEAVQYANENNWERVSMFV